MCPELLVVATSPAAEDWQGDSDRPIRGELYCVVVPRNLALVVSVAGNELLPSNRTSGSSVADRISVARA